MESNAFESMAIYDQKYILNKNCNAENISSINVDIRLNLTNFKLRKSEDMNVPNDEGNDHQCSNDISLSSQLKLKDQIENSERNSPIQNKIFEQPKIADLRPGSAVISTEIQRTEIPSFSSISTTKDEIIAIPLNKNQERITESEIDSTTSPKKEDNLGTSLDLSKNNLPLKRDNKFLIDSQEDRLEYSVSSTKRDEDDARNKKELYQEKAMERIQPPLAFSIDKIMEFTPRSPKRLKVS